MGWSMFDVPFFFKVNRPYRFLRGIWALRTSVPRKLALDAAAFTGAGWLGLRTLEAVRRRGDGGRSVSIEAVPAFGDWADRLWERCNARYAMIGLRDSVTLNRLYPASDPRPLRLKVSAGGAVLGWAVAVDTRMRDHKQFGNLRVGTIADCLALPEHAAAVVASAAAFLEGRGVDLVVSNQSHQGWRAALRSAGFLQGPSNYIFAASKKLSAMLEPFAVNAREMHINRGDGDGPIHL
jgi:hypothetical protein